MPPNEIDDLKARLSSLEDPDMADSLVDALTLVLGKPPMVYGLAGGFLILCLAAASGAGVVVDLVAILKTLGGLMSCVV